jgi:UDP-glucose 4-epimerase
VLEVLKEFSNLCNKKIEINFKPRRKGDVETVIADTSLFKKLFLIKNKTSLKEIIKSCIMWEKLISH